MMDQPANPSPIQSGQIQDLRMSEPSAMLLLNNAHAKETSHLDEVALTALLATSFYALGIDQGAGALLIALDQDAAYQNPNFQWFKDRYQSFVYIDRVIVAPAARGQGIAAKLYRDLFTEAVQAGHLRVVCEINIDPPNPASEAFHKSMGFLAIGEATIHNGTKTVRYFEKMLP